MYSLYNIAKNSAVVLTFKKLLAGCFAFGSYGMIYP
jgi:hypothetical protein